LWLTRLPPPRYQGIQYNGSTLEETYRASYKDFAVKYRAPWYFSHRADLHNELKRLSLSPGEGIEPAALRLSSPVAHVDCETGLIILEDGSEARQDIIVGADGVHASILYCNYSPF
jgi:salicylate hydroxylase